MCGFYFGQSTIVFRYDEAGNQIFRGVDIRRLAEEQQGDYLTTWRSSSAEQTDESKFWSMVQVYPVPVKDELTIGWSDEADEMIRKMDNSAGVSLYTYVLNNQIKLKFTNIGDRDTDLYTPCLTNTLVYVSEDGIDIKPKILLRRNCDAKIISLKLGESKEFVYPYKINELYNFEDKREYLLRIEYLTFNKGKVVSKIISNNFSFTK